MNYLKINQKREYLTILLSRGREAAEIFLEESKPAGLWFTSLPLGMRADILRFLNRIEDGGATQIEGGTIRYIQNGVEISNEVVKILGNCLDCYTGDDFGSCLEEGRVKLQAIR